MKQHEQPPHLSIMYSLSFLPDSCKHLFLLLRFGSTGHAAGSDVAHVANFCFYFVLVNILPDPLKIFISVCPVQIHIAMMSVMYTVKAALFTVGLLFPIFSLAVPDINCNVSYHYTSLVYSFRGELSERAADQPMEQNVGTAVTLHFFI